MSILENAGKKYRWVHVNSVDETVDDYLRENFKFHPLDIEDVMSERQRPKLDVYKYYCFVVCVFPYYDKRYKQVRGREVDIFLSGDVLITVAKKPFPTLTSLFDKVSQSAKLQKMWLDRGPDFLLYKILQTLYRESNAVVETLGNSIASVEDDVYSHELRDVAHDLASLRRSVLGFRRLIDPQRVTINNLVHLNRDFISTGMIDYFDDIHDEIEKMWVVSDNFKDTIDGLHLTNESLINQHTNKTIKLLTVISVSFMPLTLLAGVYGMNITLPFQQQPNIIWFGFGVLLLGIIIAIAVISRKSKV